MAMAQRIVVSLCAWLALVAPPATAATFNGKTSQKRAVSLVTGSDGLVTRIRISYSAPCQRKGVRFPNIFRFTAPFKLLTPVLVTDEASFGQPLKGGGRTHQVASVVGHFAGGAWTGVFRTRVILTRGGHRLDKCRLRKVTWRASPA
jgi:hypothetical protein